MSCECWKDEFHVNNFLLGHSKPDSFGQGQCGRFQPAFVVYRVAWVVFLLSIWIYDLSDAKLYMIYFTNWSYMMLMLSAVFEAISSIYHWVKLREARREGAEFVHKGMPVLFKITWVLYNIIHPIAPVVTIIYWGALYQSGQSVGIVNLTTHGFNTLYVITNIFITGIPTRLYHIWHPFLYACIYIIFTAIYYAAGGTDPEGNPYIYSILDYGGNLGLSIGLVFGLPFVVLPIMHLFIFGLYKLRVVLYSCCPCTASVAPGKDKGHVNSAYVA